jgi:pimeloyl-ACP methyl ester carboxylesterase
LLTDFYNCKIQMTIYFISGLGVDRRVFQKIVLSPHLKIKHIDWIPPLENESLENYAHRLSFQIDNTEPFHLVGLSFGGIVALEISKILEPVKVVIISSVATHMELPWYFKISVQLHLQEIIPFRLLKSANIFSFWLFGIKTKEEKELLRNILKDTDMLFVKWAILKVPLWKNENNPILPISIIGTNDKIFPLKFVKADVEVEGGGHFMIYNKAEDISKVLNEYLR